MRRKRRSEDDRQVLALAAARYAAQGMLQETIADEIDVTQPEVSRLLRIARDEGWLRALPTIVRSKIPDALWRRVEEEHFSNPKLADKIRSWAPNRMSVPLHVVHTQEGRGFGFAAAQHFVPILADAETVGIMWGRALAEMIEGLRRTFVEAPRRAQPLRVMPLCGEPFFADNSRASDFSSSHLAVALETAVNGRQSSDGARPSLFGVPAYLPTSFREADMRVLQKFLNMNPGYRAIYGATRSKSLIREVQTIVTGVGAMNPEAAPGAYTGVFLSERLVHESISAAELARLVHGDLGGVLLPRAHLSERERALVDAMNRGWTGAPLEQLARCAKLGAESRLRRGVVVLAAGRSKASVIREVVSRGLVNELVIGAELADALDAFDAAPAKASVTA